MKIAGAHAGVSVGPDGATHQAIEDIAIMRVIPHMTVVVPCDSIQTKKATLALSERFGPVYLRFAREKSAIITTDATPFEVGKAQTFRDGNDVAIVACGILVYNALIAAEELAREDGIEARVDQQPHGQTDGRSGDRRSRARLRRGRDRRGASGPRRHGLGVAETLAAHAPVPIEFIGVQDRFGQSGDPVELIEYYGMGTAAIKEAVRTGLRPKAGISARTFESGLLVGREHEQE